MEQSTARSCDWSRVTKTWGYYQVFYENSNQVKVKELVCEPHSRLSMQRHFRRSEFWMFIEGQGYVNTLNSQGQLEKSGPYRAFDHVFIATEQWHQLENQDSTPVKIVEIQYGDLCVEEDIERHPC